MDKIELIEKLRNMDAYITQRVSTESGEIILWSTPEIVTCEKCDFLFRDYTDHRWHSCTWQKLKPKIRNFLIKNLRK